MLQWENRGQLGLGDETPLGDWDIHCDEYQDGTQIQWIPKKIKGISFAEFQMQDIVRHTLVQAILQAYAQNESQRKAH